MSSTTRPRSSALAALLSVLWLTTACASPVAGTPAPSAARAATGGTPPAVTVPAAPATAPETAPAPAGATRPDPSKNEVRLPSAEDWRATLVLDNGAVGVWTVAVAKALPQYGCPEIVGLDDKGHCWVLWSYSGKWTPVSTIEDGEWLDAVAQVDLDPRRPGPEIYVGGKKGNVYQIYFHEQGGVDCNLIARFPGQEVHWFSAGDLQPGHAGDELLIHLLRGDVHELTARAVPEGGFETLPLGDCDARVRQSIVLPAPAGEVPWIACATRAGDVLLMRWKGGTLERTAATHEPMGVGRIAARSSAPGRPVVLYATRDDGLVLRLEGTPGSADPWRREAIYAGPQGPRGIACGRFHEDPAVETVAVFGYSERVQLLSRRAGGPWTAEDVFRDRDKGHWLVTAELDGRNATDELVASGYSGRITLLARPPGYGLPGVPVDPAPPPAASGATARADAGERPLRLAVRAGPLAVQELSPLRYSGGFETKTAVYETLVRLDAEGRLAPGLASAWIQEDGGRTLVLRLRDGARFHDGAPVDAEAVRQHFARWVGLPEHAWLRSSLAIRSVSVRSPRELEIRVEAPGALLQELCAINPCAVRGPGALDAEGDFAAPVGSGPFRVVGSSGDGARLQLERWPAPKAGPRALELVRLEPGDPRSALDLLLAGEVDLAAEGWNERFPRERLAEVGPARGLRLESGPGSSVDYLAFRLGGPTAGAALRRAIAAAIDRPELVERVERGHADPCASWAAPSVRDWPRARAPQGSAAPLAGLAPLVLAANEADARQVELARGLAAQLGRAGIAIELSAEPSAVHAERIASGAYDLCLERTWGVPYDPWITLVARFLEPLEQPSAAGPARHGVDPRLRDLVLRASREATEEARAAHFGAIQDLLDAEAVLVPLLAARRLVALRADLPPLALDHDLYRLDLARWLDRT